MSHPSSLQKRFEFACTTSAGREAARQVAEVLAGAGFGEETQFACELGVTEACNNAVHHASGTQQDLPLTVELSVLPDRIELRITDHTNGFTHPGKIAEPAPDIMKGRGLFLIQSMMDEVSYVRGTGSNELRMVKKVKS